MSEQDVQRFESTRVEDRWDTVLPDGTVWGHSTAGLDDAIAKERRQRECLTVIYAELILNGVEQADPPPAPAREIVHVRTTTTTITVVEVLDHHQLDHSRTGA